MPFPKAALRLLLTLLFVFAVQVVASAQAGVYSGSHTFTVSTPGNPPCTESFTASFTTTIDAAGNRSTSTSYNPTNNASCFTANPFNRHAISIVGAPSEFNNPDGSFGGVGFPFSECYEQQTTNGIELFCFDGVAWTNYSTFTPTTPPPAIHSFTATSPICNGSASTLSWSSSNATSASITDLATGAVTGVPGSGSMAVAPDSTRSYRLTVSNSAGTVTQDVGVTVNPLASLNSFSASATTIIQGESTTLSWSSSNASSASITDLATGEVTPVAGDGSLSVSPPSSRTYRLTVANGCNTLTQDVTITVNIPAPTCSGASPQGAVVPASAPTHEVFATGVANASSVSFAVWGVVNGQNDLVWYPGQNLGGGTWRAVVNFNNHPEFGGFAVHVYMEPGGTFCSTADFTRQEPPPSIDSLFASPDSICAGQGSTLTWSSTGATSASITDLATGGVTPVAVNGALAVAPPSSRSYRLAVSNATGTVTRDVAVSVTPLAAINGFNASASTINAGQSTNLNFSVSNTTARSITDLATGAVTPLGVEGGAITVTPATTRTYRLTAANGCNTVTQDVTVTVIQPPNISSFTANVGSVCAGGAATLSWSATGGTSATITANSPEFLGLEVNPNSGSIVVNPTSTTTYTLTVSNSAGSVSRSVTVNVTPAPTVGSFTASSTTINAGQSTTLSFTSSNGTSASITDLATGVVTPVPVSGSLSVSPATSRSYRFTVSGTCGTVTRDIAITVVQPPTIGTLSASPSTICAGATSTLSWTSSGGTSASITDLTSGAVTPVAVNGSLGVAPPSTRTYRLAVANGAGSVTQDVVVTVTPLAAINSYSATATTINAGQSTTLNFNVSNTTSRSITDLTSGAVTNLATESGALSVTPPTTRAYRLTATSGCNTVTQDITITVIQAPVINTFAASASPVCAGGASTLSWSASGGTSATISAPGLPGSPVSVNPNSGTLVVNPTATTTYTLTVTNSAGSVTRTVAVTVTPAPSIATFTASATTINVGASTTLSWTSANGTSATITDLTSGTVTNVAVNSSLVVTPPSTRTYRLTVTGACGSVTRDLTITVTQLPTISSFTASATSVCSGGASTLSWSASGGTSATISAPGLPGSPVAVNANSGSLVVNPTATTTYTLTVTNSAGSTTRTVTVTVTPAPTIGTFTASASTINAGQSTTLSYTTTTATSATITDLTSGTVTTVAVPNGSLVVTPPTTRTYRLTATGACGTVTRDITITVNQPPTINTFAASASPICAGQSSTLSWTAAGGTSATISAPGLPGSPVTVNAASGTLAVSPTTTTTYTLTVTNAAGSTTRTVTVTVTPAAAISTFTASASTIVQGQSTTLSYTTTDGTSATITDLTSGTVTNVAVPNGSLVVTPATTRTYRLTLTGPCGSVTRDITITVTPCQTVATFTASATTITNGQSTTLSYTLTGATSATITDLSTGTVTTVPVQSGSLVVTPNSSRSYRLSAAGPCTTVTRDLAITVNNLPGVPLIGPAGQPRAVGPTNNNDDYTNMTVAHAGVAVPFGSNTTAGGVITFNNTVLNDGPTAQGMTLTARVVPAGFTVECSVDAGVTWTNIGTTPLSGTVNAGQTFTLPIRVTYPAGLSVLTGHSIVLRLANTDNPTTFNETIDRLWTGFVRATKTQTVTNTTGVGAANAPVRGASIEYVLTYTNVTTASGTGNVNLAATNLVLTEDGNAAPNNWGATTTHVPGSASDTLGGAITGDVAGSSLLTDTVPVLNPGQTGVFRFSRVIR